MEDTDKKATEDTVETVEIEEETENSDANYLLSCMNLPFSQNERWKKDNSKT